MPATKTLPHASDSGLRGHSIGEIYPWSIVVRGDRARGTQRCVAVNLVTGETLKERRVYGGDFYNAHDLAECDAKLRLLGYVACPECRVVHASKSAAEDCCTLPEHLQR